jgi:hypothetical protein
LRAAFRGLLAFLDADDDLIARQIAIGLDRLTVRIALLHAERLRGVTRQRSTKQRTRAEPQRSTQTEPA